MLSTEATGSMSYENLEVILAQNSGNPRTSATVSPIINPRATYCNMILSLCAENLAPGTNRPWLGEHYQAPD
jgi:hypothetical protein